MFRLTLAALIACLLSVPSVAAEKLPPERGMFVCGPSELEAKVPERFRLKQKDEVAFERQPLAEVSSRYDISRVTFASPVKTASEVNNTVHCEYFAPRGEGKRPAVIVLHILGGDFELSRLFCHSLARQNVAALFLVMPYYGPRRDPAQPRRMIGPNPGETVEGMTQAILDIRRAANFLSSRPEIDRERLGIFGISLGGITGALAMAAEPRFSRGCLLLAGGDIGRVAWDSQEIKKYRPRLEAQGFTRESLIEALKPIDPVTYAAELKGRRVLMLNAKSDEVVPPICTESLCKAFGQPEMVWYDGGHYTAMRSILDAVVRTQRFFTAP